MIGRLLGMSLTGLLCALVAGPGAVQAPVGGIFVDRRCEKTFHDRHLILETALYRTAEQQGPEFTDETRLEIFKLAG